MITPAASAMFINRVRIENYKSIADCDVALAPLTVLVGANGAGKSNFLDALAFLAEAVAMSPEHAAAARRGMESVVRITPTPAPSLTVALELTVPFGEGAAEAAHGHYELEARHRRQRSGYTTEVIREAGELRWSDGEARFLVEQGKLVDWSQDLSEPPSAEPGLLYLRAAGAQQPWRSVVERLMELQLYNPDPKTMGLAKARGRYQRLGQAGEGLGSIIAALQANHPAVKQRVDEYLAAAVAGLRAISPRRRANETHVEIWQDDGAGSEVAMGWSQLSDGTRRMAGVLAALFQPQVLDGRVCVVGLEHPDLLLHPGATGTLLDALAEASARVQVIATSHGMDLVGHMAKPGGFDASALYSVDRVNGLTVISKMPRGCEGDSQEAGSSRSDNEGLSPQP